MTRRLESSLIAGFWQLLTSKISSFLLKPQNAPAMLLDAISVHAGATESFETLQDTVLAVAGAAECSCKALGMLLDTVSAAAGATEHSSDAPDAVSDAG